MRLEQISYVIVYSPVLPPAKDALWKMRCNLFSWTACSRSVTLFTTAPEDRDIAGIVKPSAGHQSVHWHPLPSKSRVRVLLALPLQGRCQGVKAPAVGPASVAQVQCLRLVWNVPT